MWMWIVIENVNRNQKCKIFHDLYNAHKYVDNQICKRIREDIEKISYKNNVITYNDGTEVWYNIVEGDVQDEQINRTQKRT